MSTNRPHDKPIIGITIGDINGIGPEVVMKSLSDNRILKMITPIIYAHGKVISFYRKQLEMEDFQFMQIKNIDEAHARKINVINCLEESPDVYPGQETHEAGKMAIAAITTAIADMKAGKLDAICTAPVNKNNINSEDFHFIGHTEMFTESFDTKDSLMFLISEEFKVGLVTGHVPLMEVGQKLTAERIETKLGLLEKSLQKDFGIKKPRIAVLGLNPHAGEDGLLGKEEEEIIKPTIQKFKQKGSLVFGPYPADGFFGMAHQRKFDAVLAMYHDQGLIPFKAMAFETGVNFTAGLPIVRTSPDHGTAYNIAGKNVADENSMRAALFAAYDIVLKRKEAASPVL